MKKTLLALAMVCAAVPAYARPALTPAGAQGLCSHYSWACSSGSVSKVSNVLDIATKVNREVNSSIRPLSDEQHYGRVEVWKLPVDGAGDCEDYALMKMKNLIDAGVSPNDLRLAQVMKRVIAAHVVLLVHVNGTDYVLDNLTGSIKTVQNSGYVVLKTQNHSHWVTNF